MQRVLLTVISLGLSLLSSTLLLTAMCTNNWIVRPTVWGNYYEGLQKFCLLSKCESLQRDWDMRKEGADAQICAQCRFTISDGYNDWHERVHREIHSQFSSSVPWLVLFLGLVLLSPFPCCSYNSNG
ncbi:uncharacterized protein LOC133370791 isoform X2 [Rhineura floridana]|uniref:uncharacterized protein LOC133370791 isoform X2 n=1 Tax=Rhineura floridana TaxID=261503 RepID=UPI002AC8902C|nr:uncharacterized protein LOC133370791 isoform X2 [Rhineura floridana]